MSKAYLGSHCTAPVTSFATLLEPVTHQLPQGQRAAKLGRTASALETARAAAQTQGFEQGFQEGLAAGRVAGFEEALSQDATARAAHLTAFSSELRQVCDDVLQALDDWYRRSESELAALGLDIAARIVVQELATSPEAALAMAREVILEVTHANSARIRVNPLAAPTLRAHKDEVMAIAPSLKEIVIAEDPSVTAGCVIETAGGLIDSTIETRLLATVRALREHCVAAAEEGQAA